MDKVGITSFFNFYTKLAESSFLCRFRVESVYVFALSRFDLCTSDIFLKKNQTETYFLRSGLFTYDIRKNFNCN